MGNTSKKRRPSRIVPQGHGRRTTSERINERSRMPFFDATGVRMDAFPFTRPRVLAALKRAEGF